MQSHSFYISQELISYLLDIKVNFKSQTAIFSSLMPRGHQWFDKDVCQDAGARVSHQSQIAEFPSRCQPHVRLWDSGFEFVALISGPSTDKLSESNIPIPSFRLGTLGNRIQAMLLFATWYYKSSVFDYQNEKESLATKSFFPFHRIKSK